MNLLPLLLASFLAPDSVYLINYSSQQNEGRSGLQFAWSLNQQTWNPIGNDFGFLKSDYGRWGSEKKMIDPFLFIDHNGQWHCLWTLNQKDNLFAHAASNNLIDWGRQSYNYTPSQTNCLQLFAQPIASSSTYSIRFFNSFNNTYLETTTNNFKYYTPAITSKQEQPNTSTFFQVGTTKVKAQLHKVPWTLVQQLMAHFERKQFQSNLYKETTSQDAERFAALKPFDVQLKAEPHNKLPISNLLTGIFFEDINYAADGGLYAELLQNRDFEYQLSDKNGRDSTWNAAHSWKFSGPASSWSINTSSPLHTNNPHYAHLSFSGKSETLSNLGFDQINIQEGKSYQWSAFVRIPPNKKGGKLLIKLFSPSKGLLASTSIVARLHQWTSYSMELKAIASASDAILQIEPLFKGEIDLDLVSLFPNYTFRNRKNGLRADLAQAIADIHPRFIRFPGGCVAHGDGLENIYRWKNSIGPLQSRIPNRNIWGYHQSLGLGYFEYLQFCEDIGAEPVPVLAAGVPCQNSGSGGGGQQGGIPMDQMDEYVQDILDLIEYCNGDVKTKWGNLRAAAGHPKPFNLKYVGIGNEDLITDVFEERFTLIYNAVRKKHPEIIVIGTVGPFYEGTDYREGWELANKLKIPMVDEHYYQPPAWFIHNQNFYDSYNRSNSKVYLGEYAAHLPGRPNNLETALSEALYLNSLEKNGDIVSMASYAPLLAKEGHTQWNPNLIYFNNKEVKTTVGYEIQKLYGNNAGNYFVPTALDFGNQQEAVQKRCSVSISLDTLSRDLILKIVNLLPVAYTLKTDQSLRLDALPYSKTILSGAPTDKNLHPILTKGIWKEGDSLIIPPYSFQVLRIKTPLFEF